MPPYWSGPWTKSWGGCYGLPPGVEDMCAGHVHSADDIDRHQIEQVSSHMLSVAQDTIPAQCKLCIDVDAYSLLLCRFDSLSLLLNQIHVAGCHLSKG